MRRPRAMPYPSVPAGNCIPVPLRPCNTSGQPCAASTAIWCPCSFPCIRIGAVPASSQQFHGAKQPHASDPFAHLSRLFRFFYRRRCCLAFFMSGSAPRTFLKSLSIGFTPLHISAPHLRTVILRGYRSGNSRCLVPHSLGACIYSSTARRLVYVFFCKDFVIISPIMYVLNISLVPHALTAALCASPSLQGFLPRAFSAQASMAARCSGAEMSKEDAMLCSSSRSASVLFFLLRSIEARPFMSSRSTPFIFS